MRKHPTVCSLILPLATAALRAYGAFDSAEAQDDDCADLYLVNGRFFSMAELPENADGVAQRDFNSMRIAGDVIRAFTP